MKKALITGASGNVGSPLCKFLEKKEIKVYKWNRHEQPIDNFSSMKDYIENLKPDVLYHLASVTKPEGYQGEDQLVNFTWPSELAWITRVLGIKFVYVSSVMVYNDDQEGPFGIETIPNAKMGIGGAKLAIEDRIRQQNPNAITARIGWQIGPDDRPTSMVNYLDNLMKDEGVVNVSKTFYPSCTFVKDTAKVLYQLAVKKDAGLYLINGNDGWSLYEIASALNKKLKKKWHVEGDVDYSFNQLMVDNRIKVPSLNKRLTTLPLLKK